MNSFGSLLADIFPLTKQPLVHCITNEITNETLANAILALEGKPIMAEDCREFPDIFDQSDSLLLNLGHLSPAKEASLLQAAWFAAEHQTPFVLDLVGAASLENRLLLGRKLAAYHPALIKGNISELRRFCDLSSSGKGVDGNSEDQQDSLLQELKQSLICLSEKNPATVYLATGVKDLCVYQGKAVLFSNGVPQLDRFTGTGDLVGALAAVFLGSGVEKFTAAIAAVSYLNCCGEIAAEKAVGLASFRLETLNQISLLRQTAAWSEKVKGEWF